MKQITALLFIAFVGLGSVMAQTNGSPGNLFLVSPSDGQVLNTLYPNFFWSYNLRGDFRIQYNIRIAELKEGQTYIDAIQLNVPLVAEQNLMSTTFSYPIGAFPLSEDKKYVWQVEATLNGVSNSISEIWMFQYKKENSSDTVRPKKEKELRQYVYLSKSMNAAPHLFTDHLNFVYNNETRDTVLDFHIHKAGQQQETRLELKPVTISSGCNYVSLPLSKNLQRQAKKEQEIFVLKVLNTRKETWLMKFMIIPKQKSKNR